MPKNINSAYRVHQILSATCQEQGNQQTWQVFIKVLGIQNPNGRKAIFEVNQMLDLFYDEIDKAKNQLEASNFSQDLYESAFLIIEQRITPSLIFNEWQGYKAEIKSVLPTLKFCSEALPNEEDLIDEEYLTAIEETLQKLEARLKEGDLPTHVQAFIYEHIRIIRKALRNYLVIGGKAFKQAVYEGYINYMDNEYLAKEYEETKEIGLLGKAWNGIKKAADFTIKAEKLLTAGTKLYELGHKAIEHIDKLT